MFKRDYFYIALSLFIIMIYSYSNSWNLNTSNYSLWINVQKNYIEKALLYPVKGKSLHVLVFQIGDKEARVTCNKISSASDSYKILCNKNLVGKVIEMKDIEFLDIRHPNLDGIFLKGRFHLDGQNFLINIEEDSIFVQKFIKYKIIDLVIMYAFVLGSFYYILMYLFVCVSAKRFI